MSGGAAPLLMTPGPTRVPERVLQAAHRVLHHRTPEFSRALAELLELLRPLFGTRTADLLPIHATGRAAMEGAVTNFFSPGDTVLVCTNGKFGEMWANLAESYGLEVVRVAEDWNRSVTPAEVAHGLAASRDVRAVLVCHSDTSTGVLNPVAEIAAVAREHSALTLVDGISSIGGTPFLFDEWGLDFAVTSSQKCLMCSPGVSFVAVGERAWEAVGLSSFPRNYLDFGAVRQTLNAEHPETPGTTPVGLMLQVLEALRMIHEETLEAVFERHESMTALLRARALELGFKLQGDGLAKRSPTLSALCVPAGVTPADLRARIRERGIQVAVGLGSHEGSSIRIGHMGDIRPPDVERTMKVVEQVLDARERR